MRRVGTVEAADNQNEIQIFLIHKFRHSILSFLN